MAEGLSSSGTHAEGKEVEQNLYDKDWDLYESELMIVEDVSGEDSGDRASSPSGSNTGVSLSTEDSDASQVDPEMFVEPIADIILSRIVKNLLLPVRNPEDDEAALNVDPETFIVPIAHDTLSSILKNLFLPVRNPEDEEAALNVEPATFIVPIADTTLSRIIKNLKRVIEAGVPGEGLTRNEPAPQLTKRKHVMISVGPPEESDSPTDKADDWLDKWGFDLKSFTPPGEDNMNHSQQGHMETTPQVHSAFHRYAGPPTDVIQPQEPPSSDQKAPACDRFSEERLEAMFRRREYSLRVLRDLHCRYLEGRSEWAPPVLGVPPLGQGIPNMVTDQKPPDVDRPRVEISGVPERFWEFLNTPDWSDYESNKRLVKEIDKIHKANQK